MKLKEKFRKFHTGTIASDNGGFSLLELIISVTILAIIITPLLSAFLVSARTVTKSKQVADANAAAQQVYEKVMAKPTSYFFDLYKSKSGAAEPIDENDIEQDQDKLDELMKYFDCGGYGSAGNKNIIAGGLTKGSLHPYINMLLPEVYNKGRNTAYDVYLYIHSGDSSALNLSTVTDLVDSKTISDMNEKKITQPMSFEHSMVQPTDDASDPDKVVQDVIGDDKTDPDIVIKKRKRTVLIRFEKSYSDDKKTVYVKPVVYFAYEITWTRPDPKQEGKTVTEVLKPDASYTKDDSRLSEDLQKRGLQAVYTQEMDPFEYITTNDANTQVEHAFDFYLGYNPYYNASYTNKEEFIIDNTAGFKGNVYLVKQKDTSLDSEPYSGKVRLIENHPSDKNNFLMQVHTNMMMTSDSTPDHIKELNGRYELRKFYKIDSSDLNDLMNWFNSPRWYIDGSNDESFRTLINQSASSHVYNIKVVVYPNIERAAARGAIKKQGKGYGKMDPNEDPDAVYVLEGLKLG